MPPALRSFGGSASRASKREPSVWPLSFFAAWAFASNGLGSSGVRFAFWAAVRFFFEGRFREFFFFLAAFGATVPEAGAVRPEVVALVGLVVAATFVDGTTLTLAAGG